MFYDDYIKRISERFLKEMESIRAEYNFDNGPEFEIALCKVLRLILPEVYGICRGFVVTQNGEKAGDDIIIYDQFRFPTLAFRDPNEFARKEYIPIEAVYGYIEAKNTVNMDGGAEDGQSLVKAIEQVQRVKKLCNQRKNVEVGEIGHLKLMATGGSFTGDPNFPNYLNPAWGAVFARQVRLKKGGELVSECSEIYPSLNQPRHSDPNLDQENKPDLMMLGKNVCVVPVLPNKDKGVNNLSFFSMGTKTKYQPRDVPNLSSGFSISMLLGAFDWISLGPMPWLRIASEHLDGEFSNI
ncbi:MAG: DUF6602 domain-containing protein [Anaerolineae bacterium]